MGEDHKPGGPLTDDEKQGLIEKALTDIRRRPPLSPGSGFFGLNRPIDYQSIGRKTFLVEQLPDGALPIYDKDPEAVCDVEGHAGKGGPRSKCPHPDCVVAYVIEE